MIDRRTFLLAAVAAYATPALAAEPNRRARIGWLVFGSASLNPVDAMLVDALAQRGIVNGERIDILFRYAEGVSRRLAPLASELVRLKPDLLIAIGGDVAKALRDATASIPIVGGVSDNPVSAGFTSTLAHPDKNFTGITFLTDEMAAKRVELLTELAPQTRRVGVIWNPQHMDDEMSFARRAADSLGLGLSLHPIRASAEIDQAFLDARAAGVDSLFVIPSRLTSIAAERIAIYARQSRLPVMTAWREFADVGCLMSYGPSRINESRRLAVYVERMLAGATPAALPIEQPTKFELVVNLRTAKAIGIAIPQPILLRADEVIE